MTLSSYFGVYVYIPSHGHPQHIESNLVNFDCVLLNIETWKKFMSDFLKVELHFSLEPTEPYNVTPFLHTTPAPPSNACRVI